MSPLRFMLVGDIAMAAYFVKANWPEDCGAPVIDTTTNPMTITFAIDSLTVRCLQERLTAATRFGGKMARSARVFQMMVARKLTGMVIPDAGPTARSSSA